MSIRSTAGSVQNGAEIAERVDALISRMTVAEKAGQLTQYFYFGSRSGDVFPGQAAAVEAALALAEKIAANGPLALIASKEISNGGGDWTAAERWDEMARVMRPVFTSQDAQEGARAFAEKRAPVWKGR